MGNTFTNFVGYVRTLDESVVRSQCGFCRSINMNHRTLTCKDCGTTNAGQKLIAKGKKPVVHDSRGHFSQRPSEHDSNSVQRRKDNT